MKNLFKVAALIAVVALAFAACHEKPNKDRIDDAPDALLDTTTQVTIGYCSTDVNNYYPVGQDKTEGKIYEQSAAIRLTSEVLSGFDANRIIKVAVALSKDTKNYANLRFWVRETLEGDNIWEYAYDGKIVLGQWIQTLVSPYFKIQKDKEYYLGYTIDADMLPIAGDDNGNPNPEASYVYECASKKWIKYPDMGNLRLMAVISGDFMPNADLKLTDIVAPSFVKPNTPYTVGVSITNKAVKEGVSSFDLVVYAGGKEIARKNVSLARTLNINRSTSLMVKDVVISKSGVNDLSYSIENVNGNSKSNKDAEPIVIRTDVSDKFVNRRVLVENFTGAACANCPAGHDAIADAIKRLGDDKFVWACHHAGYKADQFTTKQDDSCTVFYNSKQYGAPSVMLNRLNIGAAGATLNGKSEGPVFFVTNHIKNDEFLGFMDMVASHPSPVVLEESHTFDEATRKLTVKISGSVLSELVDPKNFGVGVMLVEDNIYGKQAGVNGEYFFMDVLREGPTSVFSNYLIVNNSAFSYSTSIIIDKQYKPENMQVIVWCQHRPTPFNPLKYVNDCLVYQTTISNLK